MRLPEAQPHYIVGSRQVKKMFSGNLDAPVITYPFFAGKESDFLRATIARITSETVLNVKGYLSYTEEMEIQETEEYSFPEDVCGDKNWVHCKLWTKCLGSLSSKCDFRP